MAYVWRDVLGVPRVGRKDDFFALGVHPLIVYHLCFLIAAGAREERWTTDDSNAEQSIRTFFCQEGGPL
ncbi:MAG TPA: hypothetical protein VH988_05530 [Thermoanaerobaculia bacterium]|nr:hypothetical protein [Thermoanaerobaculia bacterium]